MNWNRAAICFRHSKARGLSLLELLGAMSIVMLLTSVGIMGLQGVKEASEEGRARNNIRTLNEALERFAARGGDPNVALNGGDGASPEDLINTLRSNQPAVLRMGGPFLDPDKGPVMGGDGTWRVIARRLPLHYKVESPGAAPVPVTDPKTGEPRMTVFFELMNPEGKVRQFSTQGAAAGGAGGGAAGGSADWVDAGLGTNVQGIIGFEPKSLPDNFTPKGTIAASTVASESGGSPLLTFGRDTYPIYNPPLAAPTPSPMSQSAYWR
jgi:type II secretory pathway pseudopilin PulG